MAAEGITPVVPVDDLAAAVEFWETVLGVKPTFVDGDRWAQFDLGARRVALSGTDRLTDEPSIMVKVGDLAQARAQMASAGAAVGEIVEGPHELRFLAKAQYGVAVFYSPKSTV